MPPALTPTTTQTATLADAAAPQNPRASEDIVVTANKREEAVNRVGLSVTAIGADTLAKRRIASVQDTAAKVPGLNYS